MKTAGFCMIIIAVLFLIDWYLISSYLDESKTNFDFRNISDSLSNARDEYNNLILKIKTISFLQISLLLTCGINLMLHANKTKARFLELEYNSTIMESRINNLENNTTVN